MTTSAEREFRQAALGILGRAHQARVDAQRRVWATRDEIAKYQRLTAEAESRLALEDRELTEAREILHAVWRDVRTPEQALITDEPESLPVTE